MSIKKLLLIVILLTLNLTFCEGNIRNDYLQRGIKYFYLLEDGITITDYYFCNYKGNEATPSNDLKLVK